MSSNSIYRVGHRSHSLVVKPRIFYYPRDVKKAGIQDVLYSLTTTKAQFVVVGGLAVNMYGYQRFTRDIDIIVSLETDPLSSFIATLTSLKFRPIHPIALSDFLSAENREHWRSQRNMEVFSVVSELHPSITLDIFVKPPYSYEEIEPDIVIHKVNDTLSIPIIDLQRLIEMKEAAGRPQDMIDVEKLKSLSNEYD